MTVLLQGLLFLVFPVTMAVAAVSDLTTMTIPNRLSIVLALCFLPAALAIGLPPAAIALHALAGLVVLCFGILFFSRGWIGGGDAKIAAAAALWFGFPDLLPFLILAALFGGVLTLAIMLMRTQMLPALAMQQTWIARLHDRASGIPYGIAIAAGALIAFPDTMFLQLAP